MAFPKRAEYELIVYRIAEEYPQVTLSTLRLYSTSALAARLDGSVHFSSGLELRVVEIIDFRIGHIVDYFYAVLRGEERVRWYDPQPHPELPALASTFPHHRHELPQIKDNRRPAPGISFTAPNLATLIRDCVEVGKTSLGNARAE
jgi:hypothetical protein